jgi:AhpD family alkylhydroperoxidase
VTLATRPRIWTRRPGELIAIAGGVTRQCDGCITTHVYAAKKHGATREEIAEALSVAIAVNAGVALAYSARVMDALMRPNGRGCARSQARHTTTTNIEWPADCGVQPGMSAIQCRARAMALLASRSHSTELATATEKIQSPTPKAVVPKARWSKGTYTTST